MEREMTYDEIEEMELRICAAGGYWDNPAMQIPIPQADFTRLLDGGRIPDCPTEFVSRPVLDPVPIPANNRIAATLLQGDF